jgi:peptidyl-prolyl cis-trans isomerase SurA
VRDWLDYRKTIRNAQQLVKGASNRDLYEQFVQNATFEYYRNHAEDYDPDFAYQLEEFKEGNLLFEIMQRKIWDKASVDSSGLNDYYRSHQDKYWWEPSADAVLFTCASPEMAEMVRSKMREDPASWKTIASGSNGSVHADSGRFELAQLPMVDPSAAARGPFTELVRNNQDNTVTMGYMLRYHRQREPRSFKDARGFVINDYQAYLEDQWIDTLKQKYPVRIDEQVLRTLPR